MQPPIEVRDDPEPYFQADEVAQNGRNIRKKLPDARTSERIVHSAKVIVEREDSITRGLHGFGHKLPPPIFVVIRKGFRGFRRWSKGLPGGSKRLLNPIGIEGIAEEERRLGIDRTWRADQPDQRTCSIKGDDTNHGEGVQELQEFRSNGTSE